jgi:apolipoprotein N-acyltransferase
MLFLKVSEFFKNIVDRKYRFILISLSGLLTGLTLIFPKVGFIEWITMIPVCAILLLRATDRETKLRSLYLDGLVFFYSFYIVCYHWFAYLYPLEFVDGMTPLAAIVVVVLAWFGLSLLQALMGGFIFVLAGVLFRTRLCQKVAFACIFIAAGLWAAFEWSQTIGWWGVPWGRLPIGQSEYIVGLQTASLLGSYFITFLLVAVNCLLAYAIVYPPRIKISVIVAVSLLVFQYGAGAILWAFADIRVSVDFNFSSANRMAF